MSLFLELKSLYLLYETFYVCVDNLFIVELTVYHDLYFLFYKNLLTKLKIVKCC